MEFDIAVTDASPCTEVNLGVMFDIDPSALLDFDMSWLVMRILPWVPVVEILKRSGWPVDQEQVQLPSICCGGCSG